MSLKDTKLKEKNILKKVYSGTAFSFPYRSILVEGKRAKDKSKLGIQNSKTVHLLQTGAEFLTIFWRKKEIKHIQLGFEPGSLVLTSCTR